MNTDLLIATFNENISYIETSHPQLFSKLLALDNAVENGHYQEKYELVFDNGYFDVLEKVTGKYLYSQDSNKYASLASSSIDYNLENNLFNCSPEHEVSEAELEDYESLPLLANYMSGIAPILNYTQKKMKNKNTLKTIEKFIFFGVGLGLHLKTVDDKIKASQYLIVEDDLELFRLSLFTLNYNILSQNAKLYFSVFDESLEFSQINEEFLQDGYENNKYIKYFEMLSHRELKRQEFHLSVANQAHLRFSYSTMLKQNLLPLEYLSDSYQFLQKGVTLENKLLEDKAFLLLGAGPSLQKNIDLLKKTKNSFIIVAVSATLRQLEKVNVVPDIVVHLDAFEASLKHFELNSIDFLKSSICLFSAKTNPIITLRLKKENIFFYEDSTKYIKNSFRPSASCVGSMAYQILLYLKVKNIYLLGLDLAVDSKTGKTHSDGHIYMKTLDLSNDIKGEQEIEYKKHLIDIDGNRGLNVKTTPHFKTSIEMINFSTRMMKKEFQTVINFGDGAAFFGIENGDLKTLKVEEILRGKQKKLYDLFSKQVCREPLTEIQHSFKIKLKNSSKTKKILLEFNRMKVNNRDAYKAKLLELVSTLTHDKEEDIQRVYDMYFRYLLPYIFDYLNRDNIEVLENDFRTINELIVEHLIKIS